MTAIPANRIGVAAWELNLERSTASATLSQVGPGTALGVSRTYAGAGDDM